MKNLIIPFLIIASSAMADCPSLAGKYKACSTGDSSYDDALGLVSKDSIEIKEDFYNGYKRYSFIRSNGISDDYVEGHNVPTASEFTEGDSLVKLNYDVFTSCNNSFITISNSNMRVKIIDDKIDKYFLELMENMTKEVVQTYTKDYSLDEDGNLLISRFEELQEINIKCKKTK